MTYMSSYVRIAILCIAGLLAGTPLVQAQPAVNDAGRSGPSPTLISVEGGMGYFTTAIGEFQDVYATIVENYRRAGIPLQTQTEYPGNAGFYGAIFVPVVSGPARDVHVEVGGTVRHVRTNAYSLYGDPNGTLDVTSSFRQTLFMGAVRLILRSQTLLQPHLSLRGGLSRVRADIDQRVKAQALISASDRQTFDFAGGLDGRSLGFVVELGAGVRYDLGPAYATSRVGYRYGTAREMTIDADGRSETVDFKQNLSGFTAAIGLGVRL